MVASAVVADTWRAFSCVTHRPVLVGWVSRSALCLWAALTFGCAAADSAIEPTARAEASRVDVLPLFAALAGNWRGSLTYIDYQSQQRFGIPVDVFAQVTPDGATLRRDYMYTDPDNRVYAVSLMTADETPPRVAQTLTEAYFRERRGEQFSYTVESVTADSVQDWTVVYIRQGVDDNRPASIRHTIRLDGETFSDQKEVRFDSGPFVLRNVVELERIGSG